MGAPRYSAADLQQAFANLAPTGPAWPRDAGSVLMGIFGALAPSYERNVESANQLLVDTLPTTTLNLLPEWESSLGLPPKYAPLGQTVGQRQAAVRAKWSSRAGQNNAYFVLLAASFGIPITIAEFAPARVGRLTVGSPLYGADWAYAWQINMPTFSIQPFRVGQNSTGDALSVWGMTYAQDALLAAAPAHTVVFFSYPSASNALDSFILNESALG